MRDSFRARRGIPGSLYAVPALLVLLAGCGPSEDPGFDKVTDRRRMDIPAPAAPEPPRVVAGVIGGPGDTEVDLTSVAYPAGVTAQMAQQGQELYGTVCVACHGAAGKGSGLAPALNDNRYIHISGAYPEIAQIIKTGVPNPREFAAPMPPMGGGSFTDEQVNAIAAYVFALSHQGGA